MVKCWVNKA